MALYKREKISKTPSIKKFSKIPPSKGFYELQVPFFSLF
jgi:hypothetical protein